MSEKAGTQDAREAMFYETLEEDRVHCHLCAQHCVISEGATGVCGVRVNRHGKLYTLVYGRAIACHVDPIEKKPLYHFQPGSRSFSIATPGCNFRCRWCQNWEISQNPRERLFSMARTMSPSEIVAGAKKADCRNIAYTYTEPTIFFEYAYDTARQAAERGLSNVFVTNGYMTARALETISEFLDAANVDLKAFRDETYRKYIGARLAPVLESLKLMKRLGVWTEVTTLIVPGVNDDPGEISEIASFIADELGPETPWHVSRFSPHYRMVHTPATPVATLEKAVEIGNCAGLHYVYTGNVPGESNTLCPACGAVTVRRSMLTMIENRLDPGGRCPECGREIAGVDMAPGQAAGENTSE